MGLSLVAVFAIIATLGLMSLNQPAPVYAAVPGGSPVGGTGGPEVDLSFNAPSGGLVVDDKIIIRMAYFDFGGGADHAANYTFTGLGTVTGVADADARTADATYNCHRARGGFCGLCRVNHDTGGCRSYGSQCRGYVHRLRRP